MSIYDKMITYLGIGDTSIDITDLPRHVQVLCLKAAVAWDQVDSARKLYDHAIRRARQAEDQVVSAVVEEMKNGK